MSSSRTPAPTQAPTPGAEETVAPPQTPEAQADNLPRSSEVLFDGNPADLERLVTYVAVAVLAEPPRFPSERAKAMYLAKSFRGPALDWLASILSSRVTLLDDYEQFVKELRGVFGLGDVERAQVARTRLESLRQQGDLLLFLAEFEGLCREAGMVSDASRLQLILPKLEPYYANAIRTAVLRIATWYDMRRHLTTLYSFRQSSGAPREQVRRRAKCGKCGKRGHTANQCRSEN